MINAICQVVRFEARRTVTSSRLSIVALISLLPFVLITILHMQARREIPPEPITIIAYFLVPQVGCMLGLLLWATPAVGSEIESQTWIYIAMRPYGRMALVIGKFLVAAGWSILAGIPSAAAVTLVSRSETPIQFFTTLATLVCLSSICFSGLYCLIGVVFSRRATVFAVVYSLLVEGLVSNIPAAVNQITVSYRLRGLLVEWTGLEQLKTSAERFLGSDPAWQHLLGLAIYAVVTVTLATIVIQRKEFPGEATSA